MHSLDATATARTRVRRVARLAACAWMLLGGVAAGNGVTPADPSAQRSAAALTTSGDSPSVPGTRAVLRSDGTAAVPRDVPDRVRALIVAANEIAGRPYKWGGGHGQVADSGYDCSGAVSYALIGAGLLPAPLSSAVFAGALPAGAGRWISVYGNPDHAYLEVAGLRLDTSSFADAGGLSGVRWRPAVGRRAGFAASHPADL